MDRFRVYASPSGQGYLINVQADAMSQFNTRVVIPPVAAGRGANAGE